jgi:hypothetical protein
MLGDWEIPNIATISSLEHRSLVRLPVPGVRLGLIQDLQADPTRLVLSGSLFGDDNRDQFLQEVRGAFADGTPLTFVGDILTATSVQHVLIETLRFEQRGTRPDELAYLIVLRESPPPPPADDPLGDLDTGIVDGAAGALDSVTGALDVALSGLPSLSSVLPPDLSNPLPPVSSSLDSVKAATDPLPGALGPLTAIFGTGTP